MNTPCERFETAAVRGFLHRPSDSAGDGLVLTHGAGGNCEMPLLVTVADALVAAGLCVLRCDLPFRQKRPHGPPQPASAATDRAGLADAANALRETVTGRVFLGGQSYGGRQASILSSEQPGIADALLLLSYPLHPPGKPGQLRTAHFPSIRVPALFVHGSRDPFGSREEFEAALPRIPSTTVLIEVENAGHDLRRGKMDIAALILEPFLKMIGTAAEGA